MEYFANRCVGCNHYDGHAEWDGSRTAVICSLKNNARLSAGCSSFTPDDYAECTRCFYFKQQSHNPRVSCTKGNPISITKPLMSKCHDFARKDEVAVKSQNNKKGCFITTSVCGSQGLPDDCHELEVLRSFRDNVLIHDNRYATLVYEYYKIAPPLVPFLESDSQLNSLLYTTYILPIVDMIKRKESTKLIVKEYESMVRFLQEKQV